LLSTAVLFLMFYVPVKFLNNNNNSLGPTHLLCSSLVEGNRTFHASLLSVQTLYVAVYLHLIFKDTRGYKPPYNMTFICTTRSAICITRVLSIADNSHNIGYSDRGLLTLAATQLSEYQ